MEEFFKALIFILDIYIYKVYDNVSGISHQNFDRRIDYDSYKRLYSSY